MKIFEKQLKKQNVLYCSLLVWSLLFMPTAAFADCSDYQAVPPFLVQDLPPNVLLILDNSGSMNRFAYKEIEGFRCAATTAWTGYDEGKEYYGLFDSNRTYKYNNTAGKHFFEPVGPVVDDPSTAAVEERAASLQSTPNELWSGNWLNWWTMRRFDIAKKVLTGGRIAPDSDDVVLEAVPTERDTRRIFNDCASGDTSNNCVAGVATKTVYYTPFHQGIYSYWSNINRSEIGGNSDEFTTSFNLVTATFDVATDMTGETCADVPYSDLTQDTTLITNTDELGDLVADLDGSSYNAFIIAIKVHDDDLPVAGIIQNMAEDIRFGYMQFNYGEGPGDGETWDDSAGSWDIDSDGTADIEWRYADGGRVRNPIADLINEDEDEPIGDQISTNDPLTTTDPAGNTVFEIVYNINQQNIQMQTPLSEVLWEAGKYFQQYEPGTSTALTPEFKPESSPDTPPANAVDFEVGTSWDPYYFRDLDNYDGTFGAYVPCANSFILLISDGSENNNGGLPTDDWPDGASADFRGNGSGYLEDVAFNLHTNDIRGDDETSIFADSKNVDQTISLYTVFAFDDSDSAKATMMRAARAGGFIDLNGDGKIGNDTNEGGTVDDNDPSLFESTYNGSIDKEWDENDDDIPDTYYEADDGTEMEEALTEALLDILQQTSAGTSLSVLSERGTAGSVLHQALFFPSNEYPDNYTVDWLGTLNAYWFFTSSTTNNIREDNVDSFFLNQSTDNALDFRIDEAGNLNIDYYNVDDEGAVTDIISTYSQVDDIHKVFESGVKLRDRTASSRTIYGVNDAGTMEEFTTTNYADFDGNFGSTAYFPECLGLISESATDQNRAKNLISYIRGADDDFTGTAKGSACRNREINSNPTSKSSGEGYRWKLGDIIHSTPTLVPYTDRSVIYLASNDGMLHAFEGGRLRNDGLSGDQIVRLCESDTGVCDTTNIGKELWSFIPQNVMPYLHFNASPDYEHIYTHDLSPYYINHGGRKILIGGMRFGGGAGCAVDKPPIGEQSCGNPDDNTQVVPPNFDPTDPASALGLSSYFALDVTDPDTPLFLWEFNHPDLGLTYSGPAYINRDGNPYVMLTSGPLNYRGETDGDKADQSLKAFILKVDPITFELVDANGDGFIDADDSFKFDGVGDSGSGYVKDTEFASYNSAFGGRLFTNGIDYNDDGDTDLVFFGVNDANGTAGTVMALVPTNGTLIDGTTINYDPTDKVEAGGTDETANWVFDSVFESTTAPVVTKIVYGDCFDNPFIYFGTGRWFYKDDNPGININDTEKLYGVLIRDCLTDLMSGKTCSINFSNNSNDICKEVVGLDDETTLGWVIDDLEPSGNGYLKERTTTDPTYGTDMDIVFFTTMQPSSKVCDFGGRSRMWAVNCMSGDDIWGGCPDYTNNPESGSLLLQLSGGNIEGASLDKLDFKNEDNKATDWYVGTPPESGTPFVPFSGTLTGEIILWIER